MYCLQKYRVHINVEVCTNVRSIKYIHKYIHKGSDHATLALGDGDKIKDYTQGQYISPTEACQQLFEFPMHGQDLPVVKLDVHLEGQQMIYFHDESDPIAVHEDMDQKLTTLMAFFEYN